MVQGMGVHRKRRVVEHVHAELHDPAMYTTGQAAGDGWTAALAPRHLRSPQDLRGATPRRLMP